ncbi:DUF4275 family protein [Allorhodopirellula heiligendammensis]|uniref:Uncharacterized protein n=1 Tax=Allorhodopirellula heiligendammensis TaxID=2714739 RepID=A0A5C6C4W0_9BACT|nr:DUF4275 family protein [Allorhodopirellula heiligendammensis]TWU18496.1 hypothetical protein Poly21_06590 [Allorhodopirellula heiligendammensis]
MDDFIATLSMEHCTSAAVLDAATFRNVNQRLLERFFPNVKSATGRWVYSNYRWHGYTFGHEIALAGDAAFECYREQTVVPFYIYHECHDAMLDCAAATWPDIRSFADDIYVCPHDMTWLFTTTHEMSIGLGPFFAAPGA